MDKYVGYNTWLLLSGSQEYILLYVSIIIFIIISSLPLVKCGSEIARLCITTS